MVHISEIRRDWRLCKCEQSVLTMDCASHPLGPSSKKKNDSRELLKESWKVAATCS